MPAKLLFFAIASAVFFLNLAQAQIPPASQLLEEQRRKERDALLKAEPQVLQGVRPQPELVADPATLVEPGPAMEGASIVVNNRELLPARVLEKLLAPYQGLTIGSERLALLVRQLNGALIESGLVTSQAEVRDISATRKEIVIDLVPGRIDALTLAGMPLPSDLRQAFPAEEGDVLTLPDIEQAVHQINRLRLNQAQITILPGQSPVTSRIDLALSRGPSWAALLGLDNQGQESTGVTRGRAGLALWNGLGLLDSIQALWLQSAHSQAGLISLALPQGYSTWSATASVSNSDQRLPFGLDLHNDSWSALLGWNRVLALSAQWRETLDVSVTRSRQSREIETIRLQPEDLAVLRTAWIAQLQGQQSQLYIEPAISVGLLKSALVTVHSIQPHSGYSDA